MRRRNFILDVARVGALMAFVPKLVTAADGHSAFAKPPYSHRLPKTDHHYKKVSGYVEDDPLPGYQWASEQAYEDFQDIKFGVRIHWGPYSILQMEGESWGFLSMTYEERQKYQEMYKTWNPEGFDAKEWMNFFEEAGFKMFAFTTKHHDGFSMFDTKTKVTRRVNWTAPGGPKVEDCDLAYSIMDTPFKRDVVKELCDEAKEKGIRADLYFSHPDWYDVDFRPYNYSPVQVPSASTIAVSGKPLKAEKLESQFDRQLGDRILYMPDPTPEEIDRMMARHRAQLEEILTNYGKIDMICLDQWLGPDVWPKLRETMFHLRKIQPDVMFRARGVGNYGDYYTPEGFVPGNKENSDVPWFVIYPLGSSFSYEAEASAHKGAGWVIKNLVDSAAKGGNFMVGIGPEGTGRFHETAIQQLKEVGAWLKVNGKGIYATRARDGDLWKEGDNVRYTRSKDHKTVHAFIFEWPGDSLTLKTVKPRRRSKIHLAGFPNPLTWQYDATNGLVIRLNEAMQKQIPVTQRHAYCFTISV